MQASVLGPQSVDGVRGGSLVRGSCSISPRLTRGCQVSGESDAKHFHAVGYGEVDSSDRYWRQRWDRLQLIGCSHRKYLGLTSDLSGFSWSPFCIYHCLTSVVHFTNGLNKISLNVVINNPTTLQYVATLPCNLSLIACFLTLMFHKVA